MDTHATASKVSRPMPRPIPRAKPMTMERLRRQVFTIGIWARKHRHLVVADWAERSVDFVGEEIVEFAARISRLRADNAAAESDKAALRKQLEIAQQTLEMHSATGH